MDAIVGCCCGRSRARSMGHVTAESAAEAAQGAPPGTDQGRAADKELCGRALSDPSGSFTAGHPRLGRPPAACGTFLRIVMVNDVYKLDKYPNFRTAVREMRATAQDCLVTAVLSGDFLSPCTITSLDGGVAMLQALNEASFDYVMFGNHEFDLKPADLQRRIKEFRGKWVNSNVTGPAFVDCQDKPLPEYDILQVGTRKVAVAGFLLDDMTQFSPLRRPTVEPARESITRVWGKIKEAHGSVDAFLPMTHLNIKDDRATAAFIAQQEELRDKTPVLLGGHDHEVYIEEVGRSLIVKVGCDVDNIGVIDIWWNAEGKLRRNVHMIDAEDFEPDPNVAAFVKKRVDSLGQMMDVPICELPDSGGKPWSTTKVRFEPEPLVGFLLDMVKQGMEVVDAVLLQGGGVRGMTNYQPGPFTYGDLMREFAFDTPMAIIDLPGEVLEASIRNTRTTPEGPKPFFLHCDSGVTVSVGPDVRIERINGEPFDPAKVYRVGTYQFLLSGMGEVQPLLGYVEEHGLCPPLENCLPIKHYVIDTCMRAAWRKLLCASDQGGQEQGLQLCLEGMFKEIDKNGDGYIEAPELAEFIAKQGKHASAQMVKFLIETLDNNDDGMIDLKEILALSH